MPVEKSRSVSGIGVGFNRSECKASEVLEHPNQDQKERREFYPAGKPGEPLWGRRPEGRLGHAVIFVLVCPSLRTLGRWCLAARPLPARSTQIKRLQRISLRLLAGNVIALQSLLRIMSSGFSRGHACDHEVFGEA